MKNNDNLFYRDYHRLYCWLYDCFHLGALLNSQPLMNAVSAFTMPLVG